MISIFNTTRALLCAALLAVGMSACSDTHKDDTTRSLTINLKADASEFSRVNIAGNKVDGFTANWQAGDQIGVNIDAVGAEALRNVPLTATSVDTEDVASFSGAVASSWTGSGTLYAYYPYKEGAGTSDATLINGVIPAEQTMTSEGSFDTAAAYMVGMPIEVESSSATKLDVTTKFRQLNCFVNLSCKAIEVEGVSADDVVETVRLRVEGKCLAGGFSLNLATGECEFSEPTDGVSVAVPNGMTLGNLSAWIVVNPFELTESDQMVVEVETADYIIRKYISGRNINFGIRQVITLNLSVDSSCEITPKVKTPRTVTYTLADKSISGDLPNNSDLFSYTGNADGTITKSKGYTLILLEGWNDCTITGITVNIKTNNTATQLTYSIIKDKMSQNSGTIKKVGTTVVPISLLNSPLIKNTSSLELSFNNFFAGTWYIESFTITYE